ncbi:MAG: hypothetical protein HC936_10760 [Leptolyngbyaceae cyanobacterium SU_3_3]|nr:hypothetical protein [Leptolyngbyaceae cyanobacterium SU_3_3]
MLLNRAYFYIPLVFQIVREAKGFNFLSVRDFYWTNLYRLFIPYFPDLNPGLSFEKILGDEPEGFGAGSPGWFLLIIGTIGLWQSRKKILIFAPLITIFLLCLFYFPATFPTLKIFPWFAFNRVPGRVTVLYPVILTLFSLELNFNYIDHWKRKFAVASLVGLACVEIHTAYSLKLNEYQPYLFDTNFFSYMNIVKNQPGEAVLDWPFCIAGGNGKGVSDGMCPYYQLINSTHALRRFHRKKVVGQYFGRLHFSQIQPQLKAGWQNLFFSNGSESFSATQQARCFNDDEWSFFTDFYLKNDFAGINLYTSLLPETCVEEFHTRFGSPIAQTTIPSGVRLEFIAKPPKLRTEVNLDLGKNCGLDCPPPFKVSPTRLRYLSLPSP